MATTLEDAISTAAKASHTQAFKDGQTVFIDLELLDENPFQPRVKMDAAELEELVSSIRTQGLIQSIAVRPTTSGRCIIVAGHRRVAAYRRLRELAPDSERARFASIKADVRLALDDSQLASMAYAENVTRSGLTAVEEGRALEKMVDAGLARTNEELATLTCQPVMKIRRLRRIGRAPKWLKDAVDGGVLVVKGSADGAEVRERRSLELMLALQILMLFEHLQETNPKKAAERSEKFMLRVLSQSWGLRRVEAAVKTVIDGKGGDELGEDAAESVAPPLFATTAKRFTIDVARLAGASPEQLEALDVAYRAIRSGSQQ